MPEFRVELMNDAGEIRVRLYEGAWRRDEANRDAIARAIEHTGDRSWRTVLVIPDPGPSAPRSSACNPYRCVGPRGRAAGRGLRRSYSSVAMGHLVGEDGDGIGGRLADDVAAGEASVAELPAGWITPSVERRLILAFQVGSSGDRERAIRDLLRAYDPMLRASVLRWRGRGVDENELRQVAEIAFMRSLERFDLALPWRLSTYAKPWG